MKAGFSNLDFLKKQLLPTSLTGDVAKSKRFDPLLQALGAGVAGQFEKYCGRKFDYLVGAQDVFGADRIEFLLSRYPVLAPITTVEFKLDEPTGWVVQPQNLPPNGINIPNTLVIRSLDTATGIVTFPDADDCGPWWSQLRFTYTGGYWFETLEPDNPDYPSDPPAGVECLPDSLRLAWLLQCKHIWALNDKLGVDTLKDGDEKSLRFPQEFAVSVEKTLADFVRPNYT